MCGQVHCGPDGDEGCGINFVGVESEVVVGSFVCNRAGCVDRRRG